MHRYIFRLKCVISINVFNIYILFLCNFAYTVLMLSITSFKKYEVKKVCYLMLSIINIHIILLANK